jgi:hypothetical protein
MSIRRTVLRAYGVDVDSGRVEFGQAPPKILVIDRGSADESGGLGQGRGGERRSIGNMQEVIDAVRPLGEVDVRRLEGLPLRDQMRLFRWADIVVAQHGAALVNLIWARRNVRLIEAVTPEKANVLTGFYEGLGVSVERIPQDGTHSPVDVGEIIRAIEDPAEAAKPRVRQKATGNRTPVRWTARAWHKHENRTVDEMDSERWLRALDRWPSESDFDDGERPIFLLSATWRSGSTLAQRLLMSGGDALIWGEPFGHRDPVRQLTDMFLPFSEEFPTPAHMLSSREESSEFDLSSSWVANLYPDVPDLMQAHRAMLMALLAQTARKRGYSRWGLKEVRLDGYQAAYLTRLFPEAATIFLIRNPYEAFRSYQSRGGWYDRFPDRPVFDSEKFAAEWCRRTQSFLDVAPTIGAQIITFEDMINKPSTLDTMSSQAGVSIDPTILDVKRRGNEDVPLEAIHKRDLSALERGLGELASRWGYLPPEEPT